MPVTQVVKQNSKYSQLTEDFYFQSDVLVDEIDEIKIPKGFTMDWESVPIIRGTSKVAGLIHDYFSRIDSIPVVTKKQAANLYLEFMKYRKISYIRRYIKYWAVRMAPGYFHKKNTSWYPKQ